MTSTKKKSAAPRAARLSVLAAVDGPLESEAQRLLGVAKACPPAQWLLLDGGDGLALSLARHPALKSLKAEPLACGPRTSPWGRFCAAAGQARGKACLLLAPDLALDKALYQGLEGALSEAELVYSQRPGAPAWPLWVQQRVWQLPGLDLGAPVLVRQERLAAMAQGQPIGGRFLGPRLAQAALRGGVPVRQCPAPALAAPAQGMLVLGEAAGSGPKLSGLVQALVGALLFPLALTLVMPWSHFIGLCLLGVGFFVFCTAFGGE